MSAMAGCSYQMMIFIAGLNAIPTEQYECMWTEQTGLFIYVTIPGLINTIGMYL